MSAVYKNGVEKIYAEDFESQKHYIDIVCNDIRGMNAEALYRFKSIFIPNQDYIANMFGRDALAPELDLYNIEGHCPWQGYLMIPVYNIIEDIVGFVGYDVLGLLDVMQNDKEKGIYYKYSSLNVFKRADYIHVLPSVYKQGLKDGYIFTPDGTFDMLNAIGHGINACSLFGSYVNDQVAFHLKFFDRVYVPVDNDDAGERLASKLRAYLGNKLIVVRQNKTKDLDDILKSEYQSDYLSIVKEHIDGKHREDLYIRL